MQKYSIDNYNYNLPRELIRQEPPESREDSRLMHIEGDYISDRKFPDILNILSKGDLLILNRTRVRKALIYGKKITGGVLKITVLERNEEGFVCLIAGKVRNNDIITVGNREVKVKIREDGKRIITGNIDWDYLEGIGHLPLPPYIKRRQDFSYYQNEIGNEIGSIAAPTASLHFSNDLLNKIRAKGVKVSFALLTVGYGTFKSIEDEDIRGHVVDEEDIQVSEDLVNDIENAKGKIIGVGTTVVRSLETASFSGILRPYSGLTRIYIYPGYKFNAGLTHLITNFHIPKSSLLALVYAFGGEERIKMAYRKAIENKYYFFSLGDAMILDKEN